MVLQVRMLQRQRGHADEAVGVLRYRFGNLLVLHPDDITGERALGRQPGDVLPIQPQAAAARWMEAGDHRQQRGLP